MSLPSYRGWVVVEVEKGVRLHVVGTDRASVLLAYQPDGTAAVCPTREDFPADPAEAQQLRGTRVYRIVCP